MTPFLITVVRIVNELLIFCIFLRYVKSNANFHHCEYYFRFLVTILIIAIKTSPYTSYFDIFSYLLYYCYLIFLSNKTFLSSSWLYIKFASGISFWVVVAHLCFSITFNWPVLYNNALYKSLTNMAIYLLIYMFLSLFIAPPNRKGPPFMKSNKIFLLALFLVSTALLCFAAYLYNPKESSVNTSLLVFLLIVLSILIFSLILCLSSRFLEEEEKRHLLEQRLQKQELDLAYYEDVSNALRQVSKLRHDFKNHLIILSNYVENGQPELALHYIHRISDLSRTAVEGVFTNNNTVSAVLNIKQRECQERNIPFYTRLSFPQIYLLEDVHIVAILGNLLDNAIQATEKLAESQRRICLSILQIDTYLDISCENSFDGVLRTGKHGELLTTKKGNHRSHGFGIPSIRDTVEQYGGKFTLSYSDSVFTVHIVVPNHD